MDQIYKEVAFISYHFHWSSDEVLEMPHWERVRWCSEISEINRELGETEKRISL
ncbi:DUF6760 family protein [Sulfurovum mangrovi]|uniref:DUF6760 family protein n=1 Tax=Sulfurovum mangrovi TaxID=2893889 RepID=UPI00384E8A62